MDRAEIVARLGHQVLFQSPLRAYKEKFCICVLLVHQLRQGNGGIHMTRRTAAGKNDPFQFSFHLINLISSADAKEIILIRHPAFVGFICRDTDSTIPISASCMDRAVPP